MEDGGSIMIFHWTSLQLVFFPYPAGPWVLESQDTHQQPARISCKRKADRTRDGAEWWQITGDATGQSELDPIWPNNRQLAFRIRLVGWYYLTIYNDHMPSSFTAVHYDLWTHPRGCILRLHTFSAFLGWCLAGKAWHDLFIFAPLRLRTDNTMT